MDVKSILFSVSVALLLTGCVPEQRSEVAVRLICVAGTDIPVAELREAMNIAEDVLGDMHFVIDKADSEVGLIRTKPLPAAQSFELWRSDNVGRYNTTEANLHSIRRIVELKIGTEGRELCIDCEVKTERLSIPEYEVTSSARAYRMFSESTESMQRLRLNPEQRAKMEWIDLGQDRELAAKILKRIEDRLDSEE